MEIIRLAGYTEAEKLSIGKRYLVPRQVEANGLKAKNLEISDAALRKLIRRYTREAGVRNLEREIGTIARKVAKKVVKEGPELEIKVGPNELVKYNGVTRFRHGRTEQEDGIGLTTGLAWTEHGGDLLVIEVTVMPGTGKLIITGKLGDVMQESAHAAMSYVRSRASVLGLPKHFYNNIDIHIHVPEGAIPKDGPSAGITLATTITSALTKIPVSKDIAMTGEITLRGRVLPIGGLKEKVLAAHRGGVKKILFPLENKKDLREIPQNILKRLIMIPVAHMDEVLAEALMLPNKEEFVKKLKTRVEDPQPVWHDEREEQRNKQPPPVAATTTPVGEPAGTH
jgi:ATP-dependent Lon protease